MLRYTSRDSAHLVIKYSRSLSRYSESYLHSKNDVPNILNKSLLFIVFSAFLGDGLLTTIGTTVFPNYFDSVYGVMGICVLFSIPPMLSLTANPLATYFVDHQGPKSPLLYGIIMFLGASTMLLYGTSLHVHKTAGYATVIVALAVLGIATSLSSRGGLSWLSMSHADGLRTCTLKVAVAGGAIGSVVGPVLGGGLYVSTTAWAAYALTTLLFGMCLLLLLLVYNGGHSVLAVEVDEGDDVRLHLLPPDSPFGYSGHAALDMSALLELLTCRHMLLCAGACVLGSAAVSMLAPLLPAFMRQSFDLDPAEQGVVLALVPLCAFLFSPLVASFSDVPSSVAGTRSMTEGGPSSARYSVMFAGMTFIGMALCCVVWVRSVYVLCLVLVVMGLGQACLHSPCLPLFADIAEVGIVGEHVVAQTH